MRSGMSGTHRRERRAATSRPKLVIMGLVAAVVVATVVAVVVRWPTASPGSTANDATEPACGERVSLAADPLIAPAVTELVNATFTDDCIEVGVRSVASSVITADVTRDADRGVGVPLPDLWIPSATMWSEQARRTEEGQRRITGSPVSLAMSPIVLATTPETAGQLGWPETPLSWSALLEAGSSGSRTAMLDPQTDPASAAVLTAVTDGADDVREFVAGVSVPPASERTAVDILANGGADVIPTSEEEVAAAAASGGDVIAAYADEDAQALDFPLVRVTEIGAEPSEAAAQIEAGLIKAADGDEWAAILADSGIRGADGTAGWSPDDHTQPDAAAGTALADSQEISDLQEQWGSVSRRARLLMLVDRSGSMGELLSAGGERRDLATQKNLAAVVTGSPPDQAIGVWGFSTGIGNGDYLKAVPVGRLSDLVDGQTRRSLILQQIPGLDAVDGGSTPLYDTIAAGYAAATKGYAFDRSNVVVVFTDGRNEDPGSLGLDQLLATLRRQFDGTKPVRIVTIAYGQSADLATLRRIADTTGGRSFRARNSEQVADALASVLTRS